MAIRMTPRIAQDRQSYIDVARMKVGALAGFAFSLPGTSNTRRDLLHRPLDAVAERVGHACAPLKELVEHASRTPYGYARFWGRIKATPLLDLPMLLDALEDDAEAM